MPITDYSGIEGFCVQVESAQDVYDALDRMHPTERGSGQNISRKQ